MSTTRPAVQSPSLWQAIGIVAEREIMVRLRSKGFIVSSLLTIVLFGLVATLSTTLPTLFASTTEVAATEDVAAALADVADVEVVPAQSPQEVRDLIADGTASAGVIASDDPSGMTVIGNREAPTDLVAALSVAPEVELLQPDAPNPAIAYLVGLAFGLVFFMAAMTFGNTIAMSVVEEKQSRIIEMLLATIPTRALLAGKIIGCSILAFVQVFLIAAVVLIGGAATGNSVVLDGLGVPILWFVPLFTVGFIMIASLYAAAAALVSRTEDVSSASAPIMMLVMIPYMMVIIFNNNPAVLAVMSYIPFSAPVAVPMREFLGTAQWWEPPLSLGILIVSTVLVVWVASRIFERSVLRSGARLTWRQGLASER